MVAFAHSVVGASHTKTGKPCQDASLCLQERTGAFIAVADGHGGERYFRSDTGSRFALEAAWACVSDRVFIKALKKNNEPHHEKERERLLLQLKKSIVSRWNTLVAEHFKTNPFTEVEFDGIPLKYAESYRAGEQIESAYGSTLIAVLWTKAFLLILQIGDGSCVVLDGAGVFSLPVPVDERCFLNTTTSLCDKDAIDEFRHFFTTALPAAVFAGSDGIDDCFTGEEKLFDFYRVILSSFSEKDRETAAAELADYLPRMSEKGSGDDMSVGMIIDKEKIQKIGLESPGHTGENIP